MKGGIQGHTDLLNWQRSSTVKSLSFKWEFFLLKRKKKHVESAEDDEAIRRGRDGGFTQKQKGKSSPLLLYSRKLLWDNVLQKIEAKKENLRKRSRFGWENTAAEHESLWAAGFRPDNKQTNRVYGQLWQNDDICKLFTHLRKYYHVSDELTSSPLESRSGSMWLEMETKWKGLNEENSQQHFNLCVFFSFMNAVLVLALRNSQDARAVTDIWMLWRKFYVL